MIRIDNFTKRIVEYIKNDSKFSRNDSVIITELARYQVMGYVPWSKFTIKQVLGRELYKIEARNGKIFGIQGKYLRKI